MSKLYYFFFFAAIGAFVPFFNVYLQQQGLSGSQIGWLGSAPPLIALAANPLWGTLADRWQIHRFILGVCAFAGGTLALLFLTVHQFWALMLLVVGISFFRTPIAALVDSTVINLVKQTGASYGRQRMWGSVGFVLVAYGLGRILAFDQLEAIFWLHGLFLGLVCAGLSLLMPIQSSDQKVNVLAGLRQLAGRRTYLTFLAAMALLGFANSSFINFFGLHILALGGDEAQIGLGWAVNAVSEIPIMYLGARWFARYRHSRLLLLGFVGFALFWAIMGLATTPFQLIATVPFVGMSYGVFWVAAVSYASDAAPPGLGATAQALVGAAQTGLGWSLGSMVAGYLWDFAGGQMVLLVAAGVAGLAALLFWLGNRHEL